MGIALGSIMVFNTPDYESALILDLKIRMLSRHSAYISGAFPFFGGTVHILPVHFYFLLVQCIFFWYNSIFKLYITVVSWYNPVFPLYTARFSGTLPLFRCIIPCFSGNPLVIEVTKCCYLIP